MNRLRLAAAAFAVSVALSLTLPAIAQSGRNAAQERLQQSITHAIRGGGPLLTGSERAEIERKCGYASGAWDGNGINMSSGVLTCANGRRVDDSGVRAMMVAAGRRISRRVNDAMGSPAIREAIAGVAEAARQDAIVDLRRSWGRDDR